MMKSRLAHIIQATIFAVDENLPENPEVAGLSAAEDSAHVRCSESDQLSLRQCAHPQMRRLQRQCVDDPEIAQAFCV